MSKCISALGEFSEHTLPGYDAFTCARCWAFDVDAAFAEIARLNAENARLREAAECHHLAKVEQLRRAELAEAELAKYRAALNPANEETVETVAQAMYEIVGEHDPRFPWATATDEDRRQALSLARGVVAALADATGRIDPIRQVSE